MVRWISCVKTSWGWLVVSWNPIIYRVLPPSQVIYHHPRWCTTIPGDWPWDFWTINSIKPTMTVQNVQKHITSLLSRKESYVYIYIEILSIGFDSTSLSLNCKYIKTYSFKTSKWLKSILFGSPLPNWIEWKHRFKKIASSNSYRVPPCPSRRSKSCELLMCWTFPQKKRDGFPLSHSL